ncbi:MAG: carboxylesterase/lipase family protein [Rhodospirillaceae bacterium]|nr:carboxylesterase/lipase family protein [Rhodospirillaceae bacterium]
MRAGVVSALMLGLLLAPLQSTAAETATAPIKIETGLVTGMAGDGVESFKGIPFAAPPVGPLRWRAPQPAAAWTGVRAANTYGFVCMQSERVDGSGFVFRRQDMSEDCLTVNIFRPVTRSAKPLPVMVWIHGGGMVGGAAAAPVHDGSAFARGGVILVSINYRLGRLGLFAHPALSKENADGGQLGNYALMDQIAGLKWVQRNIAAFGGDSNNVTIFGESAGAYSVDALMISPEARGLFHRAIAESGYGRGTYPRLSTPTPDGRPSAEAEGNSVMEALGVKAADATALRAVSADDIVASATGMMGMNFILDGKYITSDLWEAFRQNKAAPVPFILGSNSHETPMSDINRPQLRELVPASEDEALAKAYGGQEMYVSHLGSDVAFTEQARGLARLHQRNGHPTYLYLFSVVSAEDAAAGKGAAHAAEIRYVFDNLNVGVKPATGEAEKAAAKAMNAMWRAFALNSNPSTEGQPKWPMYDGHTIMEFTREGPKVHVDPRESRLDALAKILGPKS